MELKGSGIKFFAAAVLIWAAMFFVMLPSWTAGSLNTGISGLSASYDNGTWNISGDTITGSVTTSESSSCTGTSYTAVTGTLTFTNSGSSNAILSYSVSLSSGTGSFTDAGGGQVLLEAGESTTVSVTSSSSTSDTSTVVISDISFALVQNVNVTFAVAENGSYTVDGTGITTETVITKQSSESFSLAASPASGYRFFGWYDQNNDAYLSFDSSASVYITESTEIVPVFVSSSLPTFETGGYPFTDLNNAVSYAQANSQSVITLVANGTLASGNYSIPSGITLLIPFDEAKTLYTDTPVVVYGSHTNPTAYKTLTMEDGAAITVQNGGAISLSGKLCATGQMAGWNGTPTGPDGRINMQTGSSITVKSGGNLYAWGYIYGSGSVSVESGATVYEAFQIKDWRGGTATSNIYDYAFIFSQYYIQNIEVPMTLYAGAIENLYSSMNASSNAYPVAASFIGSGGLFNISSGYIIKDYIEDTDRLNIDVYGSASIGSMTISGIPILGSISTGSYVLPINSNVSIAIKSGSGTVNQDISLLPSVEISVSEGASFVISNGKKVYVYDNDDWGNYTGNARLYVIGYSVANGTTAKRTASGLTDATIDVNGSLNISGNLYTSSGGTNITSSAGTGTVVFTAGPGSSDVTLYEMAGNSTKTAVTFTPPQLHNGDGTYTATSGAAAGTEYYWCYNCSTDGIWETEHTVSNIYTIVFANEDGTELQNSEYEYGTTPEYTGVTPAKAADGTYIYVFTGWTPEISAVTGDATYTAVYEAVTLRFTAASLSLESNISINFKTLQTIIDAGFENVYAKFVFLGEEYTVDGVLEDDKYVFTFDNIEPHYMNELVTATLYGTYDGFEYASQSISYGVTTYCYGMIESTEAQNNAAFKTLLVDLLNYGAAAQVYKTYNTDALVNSSLTSEQAACGTQTDPELTSVTNISTEITEPDINWTAVGLNLDNTVKLRVKLTAQSVDGVVIRAQVGSKITEFTSDALEETTGGYYLYFDEFLACEMSTTITFTAYDANETQISNVLTYSIESYAYAKISANADANLVALMKAMMKYGYAARAYEDSN